MRIFFRNSIEKTSRCPFSENITSDLNEERISSYPKTIVLHLAAVSIAKGNRPTAEAIPAIYLFSFSCLLSLLLLLLLLLKERAVVVPSYFLLVLSSPLTLEAIVLINNILSYFDGIWSEIFSRLDWDKIPQ